MIDTSSDPAGPLFKGRIFRSGGDGGGDVLSSMPKPLIRIPYTGPLPPPRIIPRDATTPSGAVNALARFLNPKSSSLSRNRAEEGLSPSTVVLSGAGISVASGLADYRGTNGTYTQNKTYRPIYFHEFVRDHEARKRYWARSFLGWTTLDRARPNTTHWALKRLGEMGLVRNVITQSRSHLGLLRLLQ